MGPDHWGEGDLTYELGKLGFFLQATGRSPKSPEPCRGKIDWCSGEIIPEANVENELALGGDWQQRQSSRCQWMNVHAHLHTHTHSVALTQTWMAE